MRRVGALVLRPPLVPAALQPQAVLETVADRSRAVVSAAVDVLLELIDLNKIAAKIDVNAIAARLDLDVMIDRMHRSETLGEPIHADRRSSIPGHLLLPRCARWSIQL